MKSLQPAEVVTQSLIALRDELILRQSTDLVAREILFKINSCLYSGYPNKRKVK